MLGQRLTELRGTKTQQDIADKLGISRARYSHYENDRVQPDTELLQKMAELFNVSVDFLLGRTDQVNESSPDWASSRDKKDLKKVLGESEVMFDGVPLNEADRQRIQGFMESMFWEAKQMNKRKKKDDTEK